MADSLQKWVGRNRPPRVQITYDVEIGDAVEKKELPLVVGVMADLLGKPAAAPIKLKDRRFVEIDRDNFEASQIDKNPFFCPDEAAAGRWEKLVDEARKAGSSLGAVVECVATGVPAGWGAPLYAKLDSELAAAMMSINAVKAVEIGAGFASARLRGEENADPMRPGTNAPQFMANNAGGIAGGISTGQPVIVRVAFKPTSSILIPVDTINREGEAADIITKGRHDPCVGIRGAPVVEAMMALVLADQKLLHRAQCG